MIELVVPHAEAGLRLDRFLARALPQFSRVRLQTLIRDRFVTRNEQPARPRDAVRRGDIVKLVEPPVQTIEAQGEDIALDILFEDGDLLVLNKPPGLVVHPGAGTRTHTLVNALLHHCTKLSGIGGKQRPGIVHRLDKETSGCLVVAKNDVAHQHLSRQFAERTVEKIYLALVVGELRRSHGTIEAAIGRHLVARKKMAINQTRGRAATTEYRVLRKGGGMTLVECILHSGRTHQIRVHLQHLGHPVVGDKLYGGRKTTASRHMLHAWKLGFTHPRTGERLSFIAPLPEDFRLTIPFDWPS